MTWRTSVIMPVRNGLPFIAEALDSALQQLGPDDEIIVVDDASTDATRSILGRIADPRLRTLDGLGRGVASARNIGLTAATGEFIAFLDHDDEWPAERHRTMVRAMTEDTQLDVVFGRIRIRVEPGAVYWPWILHQDGRHAPGTNLGNALYRSNLLRKIDGFDESLRFGEDLDYFNRLQKLGIRIGLCDVDGLTHRRHAKNATNDESAMKNMIFDLIRRHMVRTGRLKSD